jgi:S-layer protein
LTGTAATDAAAYITAVLNGTAASARGEAIMGVVSLFSTLTANATFGAAATAWNTKVAAAVAYTGAADASVAAGTVAEGQVFTLVTTPEVVAGTANADIINGTLINADAAAAGTGTTYQVSDVIDGGAGTDTLALLIAGDNPTTGGGANPLAQTLGTLTSVEALSVKNLSTGAENGVTLDASAAIDLAAITNNSSTAAVAVTGVQKNAAINVSNSKAATTVTFADSKITSGVTINVDTAGTSSADETITLKTASAAGSAAAATINATGTNYIALAAGGSDATSIGATNGIKTLTITGSGKVTIAAASTLTNTGTLKGDVKTFDASANTGGVTATVANTADALTATGGSGADKITVGGTLVAGATINLGAGNDTLLNSSGAITASSSSKTTSIDGGEGTDALATSLITAGNASQFKNFEVLSIDGSLDASLLTGNTVSALQLDGAAVTAVVSGVTTSQALTVNAGGNTSTTLSFGGVNGSSDSYGITFAATTTGTTASPTTVNAGTVVVNKIESLTINSGATAGVNVNTITLTDSTLQTLTINGAQAATVAFAGTNGTVTNNVGGVSLIDASAATGKVNVNLTNVTADVNGLAVKGGTADDTITTIAAQSTTLTGGAGKDSFVVSATVSNVTAGAGATAAAITAGTYYQTTITDFAIGDTITLKSASGTTTFASTKVDVSAAANLGSALDLAAATNVTANDAKVVWFQYGGNTYIVEDLGSATTLASTDVVVKLVGTIDLATGAASSSEVFSLA